MDSLQDLEMMVEYSLNSLLIKGELFMNISEIIKELKNKKISQVDVARRLGITKQNLSNKMSRGTFSIDELNMIGSMIGMRLAFIPEDAAGDDVILIDSVK